jgi:hypothetical protein
MSQLDDIRNDVLAQVERTERNYRLAFFGAVMLEGIFLMLFLFVANLHNRTHLLLLISTVMIYSVLALGLAALGAHVKRSTLRVLQAIAASR